MENTTVSIFEELFKDDDVAVLADPINNYHARKVARRKEELKKELEPNEKAAKEVAPEVLQSSLTEAVDQDMQDALSELDLDIAEETPELEEELPAKNAAFYELVNALELICGDSDRVEHCLDILNGFLQGDSSWDAEFAKRGHESVSEQLTEAEEVQEVEPEEDDDAKIVDAYFDDLAEKEIPVQELIDLIKHIYPDVVITTESLRQIIDGYGDYMKRVLGA